MKEHLTTKGLDEQRVEHLDLKHHHSTPVSSSSWKGLSPLYLGPALVKECLARVIVLPKTLSYLANQNPEACEQPFSPTDLPVVSVPPAAATGRRRYSPSRQQAAAGKSPPLSLTTLLYETCGLFTPTSLLTFFGQFWHPNTQNVFTLSRPRSWSRWLSADLHGHLLHERGLVQPQMCDWVDCSVSWNDKQKWWRASFIISLVADFAYEIHCSKNGL